MMLRIPRIAAGSVTRAVTLPRLAALALAGGAVLGTAGAAHAEAPEPVELRLILNDCPDQQAQP